MYYAKASLHISGSFGSACGRSDGVGGGIIVVIIMRTIIPHAWEIELHVFVDKERHTG